MVHISQNRIVIATQNAGKLREFRRMLSNLPAQLNGLDDFEAMDAPVEDGSTFLQNAVIKARYYSIRLGEIVIADDSGLEVDALNGDPGVRSARYGGEGLNDRERTALLLKNLGETPLEARTARFKCVVVVAAPSTAADQYLTAEGSVEGRITFAPRGRNGFGYDPIFVPLGDSRTTAEMDADEKDRLSHRGRAVNALLPSLTRMIEGT